MGSYLIVVVWKTFKIFNLANRGDLKPEGHFLPSSLNTSKAKLLTGVQPIGENSNNDLMLFKMNEVYLRQYAPGFIWENTLFLYCPFVMNPLKEGEGEEGHKNLIL